MKTVLLLPTLALASPTFIAEFAFPANNAGIVAQQQADSTVKAE